MSTGAGFAPQAIRTGETPFAPHQEAAVVDLIPIRRTTQNAYVFMRQTTRTNNAAEIAESTQGSLQSLAESAFAWTEVTETIRKIGHFVPVTDEQLEDIEGMEDLLRQDMLDGVRERLSDQILDGNGTAPNIEGFLDAGRTGVNSHDGSGEAIAVAIAGGIEDCQVTGFAQPDAVIMHPTDWWSFKTAQAADGVLLNGPAAGNIPQVIWGRPVVVTTEIAQGSALTGAFARYSRLAVRRGVEVQISSEHASYFIQGVKAIKAEMRATLAVLREEAFGQITNVGS
jgi:HK97 family phage major capsid protein